MGEPLTGGTTRATEVGSLRWPRLQIEHLWLAIPIFMVVWKGFLNPLNLLDFWWHLKVGELIVTSGTIPRTDLFSFTAAGKTFVHQNWLAEVIYYLTFRLGGLPLLITLNMVLLLAALLPVYHLCLEATSRLRLAVLSATLAGFSLAVFGNLRTQSFSFLLIGIFYWVLSGYREGRRDYLWLLPPLMALWVNLHGAFVLGLGLMGLLLATETIRRVLFGERSDTLSWRALLKLAVVFFLTAMATGVNPELYNVFAYVRSVQVDPASQDLVTEWQVPDVKRLEGILIFYGPFFVALVIFLYARRRLDLTELAVFLVFTLFGLTAKRNGIWFSLLVAPILARHVATIDPSPITQALSRWLPVGETIYPLTSATGTARRQPRYRLNWLILGMMLTITVILLPWVRRHIPVERLNPTLLDAKTPVGAMEYIAEQDIRGHIFHPQIYGDYLIWRLWPQQRSFFDGRVHLYTKSFVEDYVLVFHDPHWEERLAKYNIQYLLLDKADENAESLIADARASPGWKLLYEDDLSVLFEKVE